MKRTKITFVNRKNGKKKKVTFVIGKSYKKTKDKLPSNRMQRIFLLGKEEGKKAERERIVKLIELINYTEDDITMETLIEKINGDDE